VCVCLCFCLQQPGPRLAWPLFSIVCEPQIRIIHSIIPPQTPHSIPCGHNSIVIALQQAQHSTAQHSTARWERRKRGQDDSASRPICSGAPPPSSLLTIHIHSLTRPDHTKTNPTILVCSAPQQPVTKTSYPRASTTDPNLTSPTSTLDLVVDARSRCSIYIVAIFAGLIHCLSCCEAQICWLFLDAIRQLPSRSCCLG